MRHLLAFRPQEVLAVDFLKLGQGYEGYEDVLVMIDIYSVSSRRLFLAMQGSDCFDCCQDAHHWFVQWNLVIKRSDTTKPSYNKVILLVPPLYISLFFHPDIMRNLI